MCDGVDSPTSGNFAWISTVDNIVHIFNFLHHILKTYRDNSEMFIDETQGDSDDWMTVLIKSPIFQRLPPVNLQKNFNEPGSRKPLKTCYCGLRRWQNQRSRCVFTAPQ
ncbi:MAG: hypothetical protein ACXV9R_14785 [Methylobacter sp.]